jgi:hypothetical protein
MRETISGVSLTIPGLSERMPWGGPLLGFGRFRQRDVRYRPRRTRFAAFAGFLVAWCSQEVTGWPAPAIQLNLILDTNGYLQ